MDGTSQENGQGALPDSSEHPAASDHNKFLQYAAQQRDVAADQLIAIQSKIADLQREEGLLARKVEAFDVILDRENTAPGRGNADFYPSGGNRLTESGPRRSQSEQGVRLADAVVSFLRSSYPQEMHFREIAQHLLDLGFESKGQDPANTFLSYFSNDHRLERVARGTYRATRGFTSGEPRT